MTPGSLNAVSGPVSGPCQRARIDRVGFRGHGLAEVDGRWISVPGTDAGELVELRVATTRRGRRVGRVDRVLEPSPDRVDPTCPQAARCPGCPLRHLSRARQVELKIGHHVAALERMAGVTLDGAVELVAQAPHDGFRARATAHVFRRTDQQILLGMGGHPEPDGSARPVDLADCPAQTPETRRLIAALEADLTANGWTIWDPTTAKGVLRHVFVQAEQAVLGCVRTPEPHVLDRLMIERASLGLFVDVVGPRRHGVLVRPKHVRGPRTSWVQVGNARLEATLPAWTPQSPSTIEALQQTVRAALDADGGRVTEIGCGIGTLSLALADDTQRLTGIDVVRQAVDAAKANAARADRSNLEFRVGRADRALRRLLGQGHRAEGVVLHAMRAPYGPEVMSLLPALHARRVIYIAPSTPALARDLMCLPRYALTRLQLIDQMPGTAHLLAIATLDRAESPAR